jgi:hypothetical protein
MAPATATDHIKAALHDRIQRDPRFREHRSDAAAEAEIRARLLGPNIFEVVWGDDERWYVRVHMPRAELRLLIPVEEIVPSTATAIDAEIESLIEQAGA